MCDISDGIDTIVERPMDLAIYSRNQNVLVNCQSVEQKVCRRQLHADLYIGSGRESVSETPGVSQ